jgi:phage shock protein A
MWQRLTRVVRSFVGFFISVAEDPEMILQQNIRDMNDQVPRMNESIAMVKANVTLLEREEAKYKDDVASLTARVKSGDSGRSRRHRRQLRAQLEQTKGALARNQGQLTTARAAFDKAMAVKQAFMREKERKTQEALNAIADYRRSQWQKKVADAMEQFEVAGISQTHDEMVRKIEETTAVNEARMDMAMSNVDQQKIKIDDEAEKLQASELVKQFKIEMGLASPQAAAARRAREKPLRGKNYRCERTDFVSRNVRNDGGTGVFARPESWWPGGDARIKRSTLRCEQAGEENYGGEN